MIPDNKGNIWFHTDRSIHQLNTETGIVTTLSEKDGFQPQNFSEGPSIGIRWDGDIYLGGGTYWRRRFYPDKPGEIYQYFIIRLFAIPRNKSKTFSAINGSQ